MEATGCPACAPPMDEGSIGDRMTAAAQALRHSKVGICELKRGEVWSGCGTASMPVLVIRQGLVGFEHFLSDGRRALTELFVSGDIVDCRRGSRRSQGAIVALADTRISTFDGETFDALRRSDDVLDKAFTDRLREQAHILRDHCVDIGRKTPAERIASFFFELLRRRRMASHSRGAIAIPLTYAELGDYLALQPETVSRAISRLAIDGIIAIGRGGTFAIEDEVELRRVANGGSPRRRKNDSGFARPMATLQQGA